MPTKLEKQQELGKLSDKLSTLKKARELSNRPYTPEERADIQASLARKEALEVELKQDEEDEKANAAIDALATDLTKSNGRRTQPDSLAPVHIGNPREAFLDDPNRGFKSPREFMLSVIESGRGRKTDARLESLAAGSDEARGNSDSTGGFLVPQGFSPEMLKIEAESDPMGGLTRKLPMSNPIVKIPARVDTTHTTSVSGGLTVTRRPETVSGTSSQMTLSQVVIEAHSLFGLSYVTEELLTDSPISFAAILAAGFSDQFTGHLVNERLNGTGVGEFTGVIGSACTLDQAKETGQAAATVVYENIIKMRSRCWGYGKAVWLANHDTMPQLMLMNQSVGTGGLPVWQPSAREDHPDLLLGRPLIFTEFCQTLGTSGDIVLGNWSEYLEGTYQPMQSAESIHVRFVNHERAFKFWLRNGGAPWWKAALTPAKSSTTLSPFVTLATRS